MKPIMRPICVYLQIYQHFEEKTTDGIHHLASDMLRVLQTYPLHSMSDILEGLDTISDVLMSSTVTSHLVKSVTFAQASKYYQVNICHAKIKI